MNAAEIAAALRNARREGDGYRCRCPLADEHTNGDTDPSLSVKDKGDGGVLVHCLSRHANEQGRVIDELRARGLSPASDGNGKPAARAKVNDAWVPLALVPKDAPHVNANFHLAKFGVKECELFEYRGDAGELFYYVGRFDKPDKSKEFIPYTYCQHRTSGKRAWRTQGPDVRSLYRREHLAKYPERPALLVEGERKADAAAELLGNSYVVVSLSGGAKAIGKVDLSPLVERQVVAWPDHVRDGFDAMAKAARAIESLQIKQQGADRPERAHRQTGSRVATQARNREFNRRRMGRATCARFHFIAQRRR